MIAIRQLADIRRMVGAVVSSVPDEDLFRVPDAFKNHVAWNAAHVVVTQQILTYRLSGLDPYLPDELIELYRKGSGPDAGNEASYREVMAFLHEAPKRLATDYEAKRFESFSTYQTSTGLRLDCVEDAIGFNNFHEGIHVGYMMALRKALG